MYLTLPQSHLARALSQVIHLAATKSALPILGQVLLTATAGCLELSASNGELGLRVCLDAEISAPGQVLLPARLLTEFVRDLPEAPLTLLSPAPTDPGAAQIRCGQARALLKHPAFATDEFPRIARPDGETEELLALDGELLHEIVGQICFAAATDDSRPVLTAIHLELCAGQATFAAADAFRLATRTLPVPDSQRRGSWLIPARTLICLGRLLPAESSVQFLLAGQQILFHTPYLDLSSPLLAGTYPDIRQVIPTESLTRLVIQTRELAGAVRLMQSFGQSLAQLSFEQHAGQELTLSVTAPEVGTTDVHLMGVLTGHTQRLSLSLAHLGEALAAVSTSQVQIALTSERQPMLLTPVGSVQTVQVLMPRQLPPKAASAAATAAAGLGSAH